MDWTRIKEDYVLHGQSLRSLSRKYGVSYSTVQSRANRENWPLLRGAERVVNPDCLENLDALCLRLLSLAEQAGSSKAVNLVLMGRLSKYFDFPVEDWLSAIEVSVPPKFLEMNKTAFDLGRNA